MGGKLLLYHNYNSHHVLQEAEELPKDFTKLVDDKLFEYHTNLIPSVISLYKRLGVKHTPLTLITPQVSMILYIYFIEWLKTHEK